MIGYSMGAAQAVNYALDSITDSGIPRPSSLVLISPAIGVSPVAALAIWQSRLSSIPGLEKLAWNSIAPEYDPYKYNSFAVNAGDQMYRLTLTIDAKIKSLQSLEEFREFPDTLAFLSAVDATVTASAVITRLFEKLQNDGNEFVLFDINRLDVLEPFIVKDPGEEIEKLLRHASPSYKLSLLRNRATDDLRISEISRSGDGKLNSTDLPLKWPRDVYSLSHVALPFPATDALYGSQPEHNNVPNLGLLSVKGERGILGISAGDILRVKYNPFYEYLEKRTITFLSK
jgi:alpha-beta hydrolase superfamily lysophospholipase